MGDGVRRDFFVSYTAVNESWARWICVQLERVGYTTVSQVLDFRPGHDFVYQMQAAVTSAARTIAVLSPAYVGSRFGEAEWRVAFAADPSGERGLLVPVRVQPCQPPGLLATRVYVDLVDVDEVSARERLLAAVGPPVPHPNDAPFPGGPRFAAGASDGVAEAGGALRFPGAGASLSNLPARNRTFSGRDAMLDELHGRVERAVMTAVLPMEAVHGLGGVGKTELVLEFAHRFRSDYDITWWIPAEQPVTAAAALAALARKLGVPSSTDQAATIAGLFDLLRWRDRWLLIYDNAEKPADLVGLLPDAGTGSVLVTSRWSGWGHSAEPLRVDVLARDESVQFLSVRTGRTDPEGFTQLAALVGDLPLALEEAAAYLEQTGIGLNEYLGLLRDRAIDMFGLAPDASTPAAAGAEDDQRRVATVWSVSLDAVRSAAPAAGELLQLSAFLAPTIPRGLLSAHSGVVTESLPGSSLGAMVGDPVIYNNTLGVVGRYSLAELTPTGIGVHRLVQAVIRARLDPDREREIAACTVAVLRAAFPNDSWETTAWASCEQLLPQVLSVCEHAGRLSVAGEQAGWLLDRASIYLRERGEYQQARTLAERAIALTEAAVGPDHVDALWRRDGLARLLRLLGELQVAMTERTHILERGEQVLGPDHPDIAIWRGEMSLLLQDLGDLAGARVQLERGLQISEQALGPDHADISTWRGNLGVVLHDLGDLAGARTQLERALEIGEQALRPDHPDIGIWRNNLGLVLRDLGDLAGARTHLERALDISEQALGPDHPDIGIRRNNLGIVLKDLGDLAGARTQYERALEISEQALGPDHPTIGIWRNNLGGVLQTQGDLAGARTQYERALQISEQALGPDHAQTRTIREWLDRLPPR